MHVLIGIALKSLLVAGLTLGLLQLMKRRSAAERSWIAHIGLLALVIMAFAPLVLPSWNVEAPALLGRTTDIPVVVQAPVVPVAANPAPAASAAPAAPAIKHVTAAAAPTLPTLSPLATATALYAVPAAILLFITLLALLRLIALRARADVLVDGHWLSALARAQRRMGFKHGTALLTSDELASPISWGLMRPVILLNSRAVEAADEAEAIIAHELAHVARMDWIKLLLARVATALFWFNPFVWVLAREAHQLREEAADDSVLAADIVDTDYAQLLVGVARHECPGLLLGAHGVAPSKSSLARRVARVLDGKSVRGPVARSFGLGVFTGAVLVAAPLAALTLTPAAKKDRVEASVGKPKAMEPYYARSDEPTDLGSIIASGVSTSVRTAVAAATVAQSNLDAAESARDRVEAERDAARDRAQEIRDQAREAAREARDAAREARRDEPIHRVIVARAIGVTPEYVGAMRAAAPRLVKLEVQEFSGLRAVGVTPEFARALVIAGFPSITADELVEARAVGVTGDYVRAMRAHGITGDLDDFVQLRAVGVDPGFAARVKKSGIKKIRADDLIELKALGITHVPSAHQRGWDPDSDPDG